MVAFSPGPQDGRRAPGDHPNGQGAEATTGRETATAPALTESWRGSVTARGRRGRAGIGIGTVGTEGTGRDDGPAAQTGTESVEEVAAAAGTERANVETKTETAGMTGARGRTGSTIKIEAPRGRGPGIKRAGERLMTGGIKTTGRGTERRGRQKGRAGVEAGRGSTKVGQKRRAGEESAATAEIETGREMESSVLTNVVVAKRGAIIRESPVTTIVNIVNAEGVIALSKCRLQQYYFSSRFSSFSCQLSGLSVKLKRRNVSTLDIWSCCLWPMWCCFMFYVFLPFFTPHRPLLVFTWNFKSGENGILIFYGSFFRPRCGFVHNVSEAVYTR